MSTFQEGFERLPVLTKQDFVRRYKMGEFGNASPTYNTLQEFASACYPDWKSEDLYHIRNRIAGGPTFYDVPSRDVRRKWYALVNQGVPEGTLYISAMAPTPLTLFQGEIIQADNVGYEGGQYQSNAGLNLIYTQVKKPMRDALKEQSKYATGIMALELLRHYLDYNSQQWIAKLLDWYPSHTIEFSTYGKEWGTVPGFNTVFWEVRNY